jgi:putative adhesin
MRLAFYISLTMALCAQDVGHWTREGSYFVYTMTAPVINVNGHPPAQLRVMTRGNVVLRGSKEEQVVYKLVQRVKARNLDDAHRLLGGGGVTATTPPTNMMALTVMTSAGAEVSNDLEVSVPRQVMLSIVHTRGGSVEAYDLDGSLQTIASLGIRCDRIHGNIDAQTAGGEIRLGKIGGWVQCASGGGSIFIDSVGGAAKCRTEGGEIVVREAGGPLLLTNASGNIEVDRAASTVEAHTGEGLIEVNQAGGEVIADTRGGSIQIGSARGARCESAAGAIRVKNASGPLNVQTVMGSILAELIAGSRLEDSMLTASSGDVTVLIPSRLSLSVMARNDSGANPRIQSDFSEVPVKSFGFSRPPTLAEGQINGGGPLLRINVAAGIIYLKKLKQ